MSRLAFACFGLLLSLAGYAILAGFRRSSWLPYAAFLCFWFASSQFGSMCAPDGYRRLMALRRSCWTDEQRVYADGVHGRLQWLEYAFFAVLTLSGLRFLLWPK